MKNAERQPERNVSSAVSGEHTSNLCNPLGILEVYWSPSSRRRGGGGCAAQHKNVTEDRKSVV